jgi:hypothetical protein
MCCSIDSGGYRAANARRRIQHIGPASATSGKVQLGATSLLWF